MLHFKAELTSWLDQPSFSGSAGDSFPVSKPKIPFGWRITLNRGFVFSLKNHNPLGIKDASSNINCWRFSACLWLLQMSTEHTRILISAEYLLLSSRAYWESSDQSFLASISNTHVTGSRSVPNTPVGDRVWSEERFTDREGVSRKDGSPSAFSNPS